jgi:CBS domain-containing protein
MSQIKKIRVKDVMVKEVQISDSTTHISQIAKQMKRNNISSVVIVDKNQPVGIITERDIVTRIVANDGDPSKISVGEVMTKPVIAVLEETLLTEAIDLMKNKSIRRLVVVNSANDLAGILTVDDIGYNVEQFAEDIGLEYLILSQTIRERRL